jgi:hypothetical protein
MAPGGASLAASRVPIPGGYVTISGVKTAGRYDVAGDYVNLPDDGNVFIQVKVTYEAAGGSLDYDWSDWSTYCAGTEHRALLMIGGPQPTLKGGTLGPHETVSGWNVYEVPATGQVWTTYWPDHLTTYFGPHASSSPGFSLILRGG